MLAGHKRAKKRSNAVTVENVDIPPRGTPFFTSSDAFRNRHYYVKNQLWTLRKRKLRLYHTKVVDEMLGGWHYDIRAIKKELRRVCNKYINRDNREATETLLLRAVDLGREDRYLDFLNQEADSILQHAPDYDYYNAEEIENLLISLVLKNCKRLNQISSLWSAYLLLHHIGREKDVKKTLNEVKKLKKIRNRCEDLYELDESHLTGSETKYSELFLEINADMNLDEIIDYKHRRIEALKEEEEALEKGIKEEEEDYNEVEKVKEE